MSSSMDIRIEKNVRSIKRGFLELLGDVPFDGITVKRIAERAKVNRSTFYAHFDDKYDLLDQLIADAVDPITRHLNDYFDSRAEQRVKATAVAYDQIARDRDLIVTLWGADCDELDSKEIMRKALSDQFRRFLTSNRSTLPLAQQELLSDQFAAMAMVNMRWWLEHGGPQMSSHDMATIIVDVLDHGLLRAAGL